MLRNVTEHWTKISLLCGSQRQNNGKNKTWGENVNFIKHDDNMRPFFFRFLLKNVKPIRTPTNQCFGTQRTPSRGVLQWARVWPWLCWSSRPWATTPCMLSYPTLSASSHLSRIRTCPGSHFHKGTRVLFNCSIYCPQKRQYTNISSTATAFQSLPISSSLVACSLPSRIFVGWCKPPVIQSSVSRRTVRWTERRAQARRTSSNWCV